MSNEPDLFGDPPPPSRSTPATPRPPRNAPLAERMRPQSLDEIVGQAHLLGPGRILREMVASGHAHSLVLWGPPGTGKTTIARLLAEALALPFAQLSAVLAGVKDVRSVVERAKHELAATNKTTLLFLDEIHRFNKAQQDALLPHVESGTLVLVGATTENPSFEVIAPLLSRMRVLTLESLGEEDLCTLIDRCLQDSERGLGKLGLEVTGEARANLVTHADGDARLALGALEMAATLARQASAASIQPDHVVEATQKRSLRYDRAGDEHYNVISAFIKSLRGGDPDAALYYLARMLEAGEEPMFIARRMVVFASEDVGNAEPRGLQIAVAAKDAVHFVGMPEARIVLAQAVTFLACAPKSNASYVALGRAQEEVRSSGNLPVPHHLRNAPTKLMKAQGYGKGYEYPHDHPEHHVEQQYLPEALTGRRFYEPSDQGDEEQTGERLRRWRERKP